MRKTLSIVLGLIIVGTIAFLIYVITVPESRDAFTEFYILGPGGVAAGYPAQMEAGVEEELVVGIINHERKVASYRVEIRAEGVNIGGFGPLSLEPRKKFEQIVNFVLEKPGEMQKVDIILYREGQVEPYESLHLLVDVEK